MTQVTNMAQRIVDLEAALERAERDAYPLTAKWREDALAAEARAQKAEERAERDESLIQSLLTERDALLARAQKAEAVVEAARVVVNDFRISEPFVTELRAALTAYDEEQA